METTFLVVGAGTMGLGIALLAAECGEQVDLVESNSDARSRAAEKLLKSTIRLLDALPERSSARIALEAVPEELDLKRRVLASMENVLAADAVLATNTSALALADLAEGLNRPAQFVGIHFFNPPQQMPLVEIVAEARSADDTLDTAHAFVTRLGKTAVDAADTPGFIVNRIARPYYLQALRAWRAGTASYEEIDELCLGIGFKMGPFTLMDFIGLDVNLATTRSVFERIGAARFEPVVTQIEMVAEGHLGRKSGKGFYDYHSGERPPRSVAPLKASDEAFDERVCVIGFGSLADEIATLVEEKTSDVTRIENEEFLTGIDPSTTIAFDAGDGTTDRSEVLLELDTLLDPSCAIFVDAYSTDLRGLLTRARHPERFVGFGILGALEAQQVVEIVDSDAVDDEMLALAQEFFESLGRRVVLVAPAPGLVLGRILGSIVNEAMIAVYDGVASADDIDLAMRLGTNYPLGPISWGREIGGARIARILRAIAQAEGADFGAHRSLWLLDLEEGQESPEGIDDGTQPSGTLY